MDEILEMVSILTPGPFRAQRVKVVPGGEAGMGRRFESKRRAATKSRYLPAIVSPSSKQPCLSTTHDFDSENDGYSNKRNNLCLQYLYRGYDYLT